MGLSLSRPASARPVGTQEQRYLRLVSLLEKLRAVCSELGEDDKYAAADVHPSLANVW